MAGPCAGAEGRPSLTFPLKASVAQNRPVRFSVNPSPDAVTDRKGTWAEPCALPSITNSQVSLNGHSGHLSSCGQTPILEYGPGPS